MLNHLTKIIGCKGLEASTLALQLNVIKKDPTGRDTFIISDFKSMINYIRNILRRECVILASVYPSDFYTLLWEEIPFVLILRIDPRELEKRLIRRNWIRPKILENVLSEAFGSIYDNVDDSFMNSIIEIDVTNKNVNVVIDEFFRKLHNNEFGIKIDWLQNNNILEKVTRWLHEFDSYRYGFF